MKQLVKSFSVSNLLESKTYYGIVFTFTILFILLLSGCNKDQFADDLNEYLGSLPPISVEFPDEKAASVVDSAEEKDLEYIYKIEYYSVAEGFDEQIVLNPQTDVIYPGALIKGESILDGSYVPIPAERKPITISTSLTGGDKVSIDIEDPKLSTVRTAVNDLMNQEYDVQPANVGYTIKEAYSKEQLQLSLRASYNGVVDVEAGFDYDNKSIKTRLVAKFIQSYYTLDMDLPSQPSDLFDEEVDNILFGSYMPMYVSSVTFGRMALFTIESELEETEIRSFLNASFSGASGSASLSFEDFSASSTMQVYILGGSGDSAAKGVEDYTAFTKYITEGGSYSKDSPGAPISYKLRYIKDNTIGRIVLAASYPIRTAIPRTDNIVYDVDVQLYSITSDQPNDGGDGLDMYGDIFSWHRINGEDFEVNDHFGYTQTDWLPLTNNEVYVFNPATDGVAHLKESCKIEDDIVIRIDIWDYDTNSGDDHFTPTSFSYSVEDIVLGVGGEGFFKTDPPMRVEFTVPGKEAWAEVVFRFYPEMRRIPD